LSWLLSLSLVAGLSLFVMGYFWGQRRAVAQFVDKIEEESFADKITYSLYTMNGKDHYTSQDKIAEEESAAEEGNDEPEALEEKEQSGKLLQKKVSIEDVEKLTVAKNDEIQTTYIAPLVGFGTSYSAEQFTKRVEKMGIPVFVKRRVSKTSVKNDAGKKRKTIVWYQVVTDVYKDRNEIEHVVMRIKDKENIKDVKIIERKKG
jgi:hypothetical protein